VTRPSIWGWSSALLRKLADRVVNFVQEIGGSAFTTVRQRVARHLLDLAAQESRSGWPRRWLPSRPTWSAAR
jgi:hypothetical protein